jgi:hypothetical protein
MADLRIPLTDTIIKELEPPGEGQYVVRDATQKGFYVLIGKRKRTFMVHGDLNVPGRPVKSIKVSVGDINDLTTTKARTIARGYLSEMAQGRHPKPKELPVVLEGSADSAAERPGAPCARKKRPEVYSSGRKSAGQGGNVSAIRRA